MINLTYKIKSRVWVQTRDHIEDQLINLTWWQVYSQIRNLTYERFFDHVSDQLRDQLR